MGRQKRRDFLASELAEVKRRVERGEALEEIASLFRRGVSTIRKLANRRGWKPKGGRRKARRLKWVDPTPEQIAERAAEIREEWDAWQLMHDLEFGETYEDLFRSRPRYRYEGPGDNDD